MIATGVTERPETSLFSIRPMKNQIPKVVLVVGRKNVGKTTLIEKLIPELSSRGYRVGTIKHHHSKSSMRLDCEGKDSWRHRRAGARAVAVASPSEVAVFQDTEKMTPLDDLIQYLKGVDIVLVEGFHSESKPKIEIRRTLESGPTGFELDEHLFAIVTPERRGQTIPCFTPDDIRPLADLIEKRILRKD